MVCAFLISLGKEKSIEYLNATFHIQDRWQQAISVLNKGYIILNIMYKNDKVIRRYSEQISVFNNSELKLIEKYQRRAI